MSPLPSAEERSVLVTGATGLLGGHLAAALQRRGYQVRALARETSDVRRLGALGVEIVRGDVTDRAALERAAAGARTVFHAAAKVSDWAPREEFVRVNFEGTRNVVAACQARGVARLVHLSSLTVLGLPRRGDRIDESTPWASRPVDPYTDTKRAAEAHVRENHGVRGLATTVVRPGVIWGPGDVTILPRFVALLRRGRMILVDGGKNVLALSHVDNLSLGIALAAETPAAAGGLYHVLDDEELTAREALELIAAAAGCAPPSRSLPFPVVYALAGLLELAAHARRRREPPAMTRYGVRLVSCDGRYERAKARRELGYAPTVTFRDGIRALFSHAEAA